MKLAYLFVCAIFNYTFSIVIAQQPSSRGFANANSIEFPIDYKIEKTISYLQELSKSKKNSKLIDNELSVFFTDSGYFILEKSEKVELWVPVSMISDKVSSKRKIIYKFKEARVVHYDSFTEISEGKYTGKAVVYDGVTGFDSNHQPIATKVSHLTVPFDQKPISDNYWQIYELKLSELKK
jgi:hypothetical protein